MELLHAGGVVNEVLHLCRSNETFVGYGGFMYGAARTVCLKTTVLAACTVPVRSCCWDISVVLSVLFGFVF